MIHRSLLSLVGITVAGLASAHHSTDAMFDAAGSFVLEAIIEDTVWMNPHAYLLVYTQSEGGEVERWAVEIAPPNALQRNEMPRAEFVTGTPVTITAHPARQGVELSTQFMTAEVVARARAGRLVHGKALRLPNGKTFEDNAIWMSASGLAR